MTNEFFRGQSTKTSTLVDYAGASLASSLDISLESPGSLFRLFLGLARSQHVGILGLQSETGTTAISISNGTVIKTSVENEDEDEALALTLLQDNLITRERLVRAAGAVDKTGESLARSLFNLNLLDSRSLVRGLKATHARHLLESLSEPSVTFTFAPNNLLGEGGKSKSPTHVSLLSVLHTHLNEFLKETSFETLVPLLTPLRTKWLRVPTTLHARLGPLGFSKRELHAIESLINGAYRLDNVLRLTAMSRNASGRLCFKLGVLGLLDLLDESTHKQQTRSDDEQLEAKRNALATVDYFERLRVHWSTPHRQLKEAYAECAKEFGPSAPGRARPGTRTAQLQQEIWALMEDSWRQLQDEPKRQRYRESLLEPSQLGFSADLLIAQGRTAELRRRWKDARDLYETAHELRPTTESDRALKLLDAREYEWMKRLREKQSTGGD